ncbi:MAG: hypothetical protein DI634_01935 [Kocuria palustris]|nr:MAG: hypothetical protein DI634_01935 [Kocuria palustris]
MTGISLPRIAGLGHGGDPQGVCRVGLAGGGGTREELRTAIITWIERTYRRRRRARLGRLAPRVRAPHEPEPQPSGLDPAAPARSLVPSRRCAPRWFYPSERGEFSFRRLTCELGDTAFVSG